MLINPSSLGTVIFIPDRMVLPEAAKELLRGLSIVAIDEGLIGPLRLP
jgi:hypothetical protein